MIKATNLIKSFEASSPAVIKKINLEIKNGEFISLTGRSGSGKSTLLYLISTLDRHFDGEIHYDGKNVKDMSVTEVHQLRNRQIGFVFQFHYLLGELTALENVLLAARKANVLNEKKDFAYQLLKDVGLTGKEHRLPSQLSGGEQQRVAIARSLIMKPNYLFADEPTGNLDSANGDIVINLFEKFNHDFKTTIIFVTHDHEYAKRAQRQISLIDGEIA